MGIGFGKERGEKREAERREMREEGSGVKWRLGPGGEKRENRWRERRERKDKELKILECPCHVSTFNGFVDENGPKW